MGGRGPGGNIVGRGKGALLLFYVHTLPAQAETGGLSAFNGCFRIRQ